MGTGRVKAALHEPDCRIDNEVRMAEPLLDESMVSPFPDSVVNIRKASKRIIIVSDACEFNRPRFNNRLYLYVLIKLSTNGIVLTLEQLMPAIRRPTQSYYVLQAPFLVKT